MGAGGFWDDQENAAKVSAEHARVQRRIGSYRSLESDVDDLDALVEMAKEDESMAEELEAMLDSMEDRL
jgi:peptide chain release factor 2